MQSAQAAGQGVLDVLGAACETCAVSYGDSACSPGRSRRARLFLADRLLQRDQVLSMRGCRAPPVVISSSTAISSGRSPEALHQLALDVHDLVRFDHVHRDADRARLVDVARVTAAGCTTSRTSRTLALAVVNFSPRGLAEAFLDQIEEAQAPDRVDFAIEHKAQFASSSASRAHVAALDPLGQVDLLAVRSSLADLA